jgi:hypothetical protein
MGMRGHVYTRTFEQEAPGTHCTEGWGDPRGCLDEVEKGKLRTAVWNRSIFPLVAQPAASLLCRLSYQGFHVTLKVM